MKKIIEIPVRDETIIGDRAYKKIELDIDWITKTSRNDLGTLVTWRVVDTYDIISPDDLSEEELEKVEREVADMIED